MQGSVEETEPSPGVNKRGAHTAGAGKTGPQPWTMSAQGSHDRCGIEGHPPPAAL